MSVGQRWHAPRRGTEDGFVAGSEALIMGVLVFVFGTLVLLNAWGAIDGRFAAAAAAREAVRAAVVAPLGADLAAVAQAAAHGALDAHGVDPARATVTMLGTPVQERCAEVRVEVELAVPLAVVPWLGAERSGVRVRARHAELIDPHRSGLPVGGDCGW